MSGPKMEPKTKCSWAWQAYTCFRDEQHNSLLWFMSCIIRPFSVVEAEQIKQLVV